MSKFIEKNATSVKKEYTKIIDNKEFKYISPSELGSLNLSAGELESTKKVLNSYKEVVV